MPAPTCNVPNCSRKTNDPSGYCWQHLGGERKIGGGPWAAMRDQGLPAPSITPASGVSGGSAKQDAISRDAPNKEFMDAGMKDARDAYIEAGFNDIKQDQDKYGSAYVEATDAQATDPEGNPRKVVCRYYPENLDSGDGEYMETYVVTPDGKEYAVASQELSEDSDLYEVAEYQAMRASEAWTENLQPR